MRIALRVPAAALAAACGLALAVDPAPPDNYQGLWWNPAESGWGLSIAHQGEAIIATWYTYDLAGRGIWLTLDGRRTPEGSYAGEIVEAFGASAGAVPYDPDWVTTRAVGSGSLTFHDADNGTFTYAAKGWQQAKEITRDVFGPVPECRYEKAADLAAARNYTDAWCVRGEESAWGVHLVHQGDVLFAQWFTLDNLGAPRWFIATAPRVAPGVFAGPLLRTQGPAWGLPTFESAGVEHKDAGAASFTFAHGNAATFTYTVDGVAHAEAITRRLVSPPAGTRCRAASAAMISGTVFTDAPAHALVCADVNANGRCDAPEPQARTDASGAYELVPPSGFDGALVAELGEAPWRMSSPGREYSTHITPFTTLVHMAAESYLPIAEMRVRNDLGLPPRFPIALDAAPAQGSLTQAVAGALAAALEAAKADLASPDGYARVIGALPAALTEMPQLRIWTTAGLPVDSKEVYRDATYDLSSPISPQPAVTLKGKIRGRGNYTWQFPKKPYKVQFANDEAYAAIADVLGMKKNRNWALLADYADRTLMRNQLAFTLGNSALFADGLKWTPSGVHVEVWLNGDYVGVYLLSEDIRVDPARLAIRKMGTADLDGGYIAEIDWPLDCYNDGTINLQHVTPRGVHVCVKTPDEESATRAQIDYIKDLIDTTERDIYDGARIERINPASFADWYLLQELLRNYDAPFYSSDYLWKDTDAAASPTDRLLNMGPIWDFDIAAGNLGFADAWRPQGCWVTRSRESMPNWFTEIFDSRDMLDLTLARWKDKRAALERLVASSIDSFARRMDAAQRRNFARWPILESPLDSFGFRTYDDHVRFLKSFLLQRMGWLDQAYFNRDAFAAMCR